MSLRIREVIDYNVQPTHGEIQADKDGTPKSMWRDYEITVPDNGISILGTPTFENLHSTIRSTIRTIWLVKD